MSQPADRLFVRAISIRDKKNVLDFIPQWITGSNNIITKNEDAAEIFVQAGNQYKIIKDNQRAAESFQNAADCYLAASNIFESINQLKNVYKITKSVDILFKIADLELSNGRFQAVANIKQEIGEYYESIGDLRAALENYNHAQQWFNTENQNISVSKCNIKIATLSALIEDYSHAASLFETEAINPFSKFIANDYLLKMGLCYLANDDIVGAKQGIERAKSINISFESSYEYRFLENITRAYEERNTQEFSAIVYEYDQLKKLNDWFVKILLKIKHNIIGDENGISLM